MKYEVIPLMHRKDIAPERNKTSTDLEPAVNPLEHSALASRVSLRHPRAGYIRHVIHRDQAV